MATRVEDILGLEEDTGEVFKTINVEKPLDCEFDVGELLVVDPNAIEEYNMK